MPSPALLQPVRSRPLAPAFSIVLVASLVLATVVWRSWPSASEAATVTGQAAPPYLGISTAEPLGTATPAAPVAAAAPVAPTPGPDVLANTLASGIDRPPPPSRSGAVAPRAPRSSGGGGTSGGGAVPSPEPAPAPEPEPAPPAAPAPGAAGQVLSMLNGYRSANGLAPLSGAGDAMAKAQAHAESMAAAGSIWHSNLASGIGGWSALAENVGVGASASQVHNGFVGSSSHRGNMLGDFNQVGVGAAVGGDGRLYVCQVFVLR